MNIFGSESVKRLFSAIANLKTEKECEDFFADLCTIKEIRDMAQRLETAILLNDGENYQAISAKVGVSSATISRVSRCLNYGAGGYRAVIGDATGEKDGNEDQR
ncbi:MAG: hypothetical protein IK147_05175 [Clostridia bacterium]|nr:hypothetical protein [Clostridia bacterium]MBR5388831.1 hypothetical protein [Clostridia bacterium]